MLGGTVVERAQRSGRRHGPEPAPLVLGDLAVVEAFWLLSDQGATHWTRARRSCPSPRDVIAASRAPAAAARTSGAYSMTAPRGRNSPRSSTSETRCPAALMAAARSCQLASGSAKRSSPRVLVPYRQRQVVREGCELEDAAPALARCTWELPRRAPRLAPIFVHHPQEDAGGVACVAVAEEDLVATQDHHGRLQVAGTAERILPADHDRLSGLGSSEVPRFVEGEPEQGEPEQAEPKRPLRILVRSHAAKDGEGASCRRTRGNEVGTVGVIEGLACLLGPEDRRGALVRTRKAVEP